MAQTAQLNSKARRKGTQETKRPNPSERGYNKTVDKELVKERLRDRKCPYCAADRKDLAYENIENDGKEVFQVVDCTACEKHFTEVFSFSRVILTDCPGEDFRVDFSD